MTYLLLKAKRAEAPKINPMIKPNTKLFHDQLKLDKNGYIKTSSNKTSLSATDIPGVFACGDVQDSQYRQAVTAAGSGSIAAIDVKNYLEEKEYEAS